MIKVSSKSEVFKNWVEEIDGILSKTQILTATGDQMEYSDPHFQDQMKRLTSCALRFTDMPIYPINEQVAVDLLWDEIENKQEEQDAASRDI